MVAKKGIHQYLKMSKQYKYSKTSRERLNTCHSDIQTVMEEVIQITRIDLGISEGHRSIEKQQEYFNQGKSQIDGVHKKGKHNYFPSRAVDIYAFVDGSACWDIGVLCYLAGIIVSTSIRLKKEGKIQHELRWGGNWDRDGVVLSDQSFDDLPHFELI